MCGCTTLPAGRSVEDVESLGNFIITFRESLWMALRGAAPEYAEAITVSPIDWTTNPGRDA